MFISKIFVKKWPPYEEAHYLLKDILVKKNPTLFLITCVQLTDWKSLTVKFFPVQNKVWFSLLQNWPTDDVIALIGEVSWF